MSMEDHSEFVKRVKNESFLLSEIYGLDVSKITYLVEYLGVLEK